jgi:hypothetical protein
MTMMSLEKKPTLKDLMKDEMVRSCRKKKSDKLSHTMPYFKFTKRFDLHNFHYYLHMF